MYAFPLCLALASFGAPETAPSPIKTLQEARTAFAKAEKDYKAAAKELKEAEAQVAGLIKQHSEDLKALKEALEGVEEEKPSKPARRIPRKKAEPKDDKSQGPRQGKEYALTKLEREVAEKTAQERRARRQGQEPDDPEGKVATLEMKIPSRARVWIGGKRKRDSGKERSYTSPALKEGEEYTFKVRIRWKDQEVKRSITVRAGETMILAVGKARVR